MASARIPKKPNSLEEQVDPRVQVELERLNTATDDINRLEVDLDEARAGFRNLLAESSYHIECLSKKLGTSLIDKAKPYYDARIAARQALGELHKAAVRFERANSAHAASKEMVYLAEEGLTMEGRTFDHAWQEMLNHATIRVNESETERTLSEAQHKKTSIAYQAAEMKVHQLQKDLKRTIAKTRPYFEAKAHFNKLLEAQKDRVKDLEDRVSGAKSNYAEALRNLERISDEIHKCRKGVEQMHLRSPIETASSTTQDSSDSTGSADSYPADEYLRLPDRIGPGSTPLSPQDESFQLGAYKKLNEEISPYEPCRSDFFNDDTTNSYYSSKPSSTFISTAFPGNEEWCEIPLATSNNKTPTEDVRSKSKFKIKQPGSNEPRPVTCSPGRPVHPPRPALASRRQSIDALLSGSTDKVKEILSHGILKLNIGSLNERRGSLEGSQLRPSSRTSNRELSTSDNESFTGVEMLTDDQISSLMLDRELQEACHDILFLK